VSVQYENRPPAEGINVSHDHPLREFAWLLGGGIAAIALIVLAIGLAADWIAPRIPYRYEARLAGQWSFAAAPGDETGRSVQAELQALADRLAARMQLPPEMKVQVGFQDGPTVNAFATLGGRTVFFGGLLARLESEDALAMVMAHEIAHLKLRHPAQALGRGVATGIVLSMISADLGRSAAGGVLGQAGMLTLLSFNRDQERAADAEALRVLAAEYGHVGGAVDLFVLFGRLQAQASVPSGPAIELLRTHPVTAARAEVVAAWAGANGVPLDGKRRPLSPAVAALKAKLKSAPEAPERP